MSQKQELIQLHQLLAQTRFHIKEEFGLPAEIPDLHRYKQIGITSIDLNAEITTQEDAILALAKDIVDVMDVHATRPSAKGDVSSPTGETTESTFNDFAGPTEKTMGFNPESSAQEPETMRVEAQTPQSQKVDARTVKGYESDETAKSVELLDVSLDEALRDLWENQRTVEQWGDDPSYVVPGTEEVKEEIAEIVESNQKDLSEIARGSGGDTNAIEEEANADDSTPVPTP